MKFILAIFKQSKKEKKTNDPITSNEYMHSNMGSGKQDEDIKQGRRSTCIMIFKNVMSVLYAQVARYLSYQPKRWK